MIKRIDPRRSNIPDRGLGVQCDVPSRTRSRTHSDSDARSSWVPGAEFQEQVRNCYGLIITGDPRKRGNVFLRKGLDVTPDSIHAMGGQRGG